jgi:A/G-specific adenine glycosylase
MKTLRHVLLTHYRQHRRTLPWRQTRDPYCIWVSEIMLQQTQVDTVVPRYHQFLARFPTVVALAQASEEEVCEAWAGLGYYRRARNLHKAACQVVQTHMPTTVRELQTLPGIGRYTAGAIASIAFEQTVPLVDGNVERVLSRLYALTDLPKSPSGQKKLWSLAEQLVQGEAPGDFNQALMELGALICTPLSPRCSHCPVQTFCQANKLGIQEDLPTRVPNAPKQELHMAFAWIQTAEGVWLERRPLDGLWAGLWELPSATGNDAKKQLQSRFAISKRTKAEVTTELTHRHVKAKIFEVQNFASTATLAFKPFAKPLDAALSGIARKAVLALSG